MESPHDLHALGRIIVAIKRYRHQTGDYFDPTHNEQLNAFLAEQLPIRDLPLWQQLRAGHHETTDFKNQAYA